MEESAMRTLTTKTKGIILCGFDTIADTDVGLTASKGDFKVAVERAQLHGYLVGLVSDRPAKILAGKAFEWEMRGPLIIENGAAIMLDAADEVRGVEESTRSFPQLQKLFVETVQLLDDEGLGYRLISGDSGHVAMHPQSADWLPESITTIVIMNGEHEYSLSFSVRNRVTAGKFKGDWEPHTGELRYLSSLAEKVIVFSSNSHRFRTTLREDIGACTIADKSSTKLRCLYLLREYIGPDMPVIMIGSSMSDFLDSSSAEHYGVSNATDDYRDHCTYCGGKRATQGVIELLEYIIDPHAAYK